MQAEQLVRCLYVQAEILISLKSVGLLQMPVMAQHCSYLMWSNHKQRKETLLTLDFSSSEMSVREYWIFSWFPSTIYCVLLLLKEISYLFMEVIQYQKLSGRLFRYIVSPEKNVDSTGAIISLISKCIECAGTAAAEEHT